MEGVSVIIPCRNGAKYLRECLESILAQDYAGPLEVVVADDGSTDGSQGIVESFGPRVRLLPCPEGASHGPAAARNRALRVSANPLIAFLDADDLWLPGHLSELASAMAAQPELGLVCDNGYYIDGKGRTLGVAIAESAQVNLRAESLLLDCFIDPSGVMIRRRVMERVGLFDESPELLYVEDHDMWLRLTESLPGAYVPWHGYCYRIHSEQVSWKPLLWENAEQVLAKAIARHPYSGKVVRKRRAVLAYRHSQIAFRQKAVHRGMALLGKAALLDPVRAAKELASRVRQKLRSARLAPLK